MKIKFLFFVLFLSLHTYAIDFNELISSFSADESALERKYPNSLSDIYFERFSAFYQDWKTQLESIDFKQLTKDQKVDYILLKNKINKNAYFLSLSATEFNKVKFVVKDLNEIYVFNENRKVGLNPKSDQLAAIFNEATKSIQKEILNLKNIKQFDSWQSADLAANIVNKLKESTAESYEFYNEYNPEFMWWMKSSQEKLNKTLIEYQDLLRKHYSNTLVKDDGSGIIGKPLGRTALLKDLNFEFIVYTPEQLITEANNQFAWCEKEMLKASNELGYGNDWKKALEHVKQTYVKPGQWQEDVNKLALEAVSFVQDRDLITVPPLAKETWRMTMLSS